MRYWPNQRKVKIAGFDIGHTFSYSFEFRIINVGRDWVEDVKKKYGSVIIKIIVVIVFIIIIVVVVVVVIIIIIIIIIVIISQYKTLECCPHYE